MKRAHAVVNSLAFLFVAACNDAVTSRIIGPGVATQVTGDYVVTNSNDEGAGSFRDAITQANGNTAIATIAFEPSVNTIALQSPVTYSGTQDLTINGNHATLDASAAGGSAFVATSDGADVSITGLTVRNAAGEGIAVEVNTTASGTVRVSLADVEIADNSGHGFLVDDQNGVDGSPAAVEVVVTDTRMLRNGFSVSDRDGIRINEGGDGNLTFTISNSRSDGNGADGIELDEKGSGDVIIDVRRLTLTSNGIFDPTDLDDGFDIDEAGPGSIRGQVVASAANHNYEQGFDFNENDAGDLRVDLTDVEANYNLQEGVEYEEDDDNAAGTGGGDIVTVMNRITTIGNAAGDAGLKIREKQAGNLTATLTNIISSQNALHGIQLREGQGGNITASSITKAVTNGNGGNGVHVEGTNTTSAFVDITTSANAGFGLFVEAGTANTANVKGGANALGLTGGGATFN